MKAEGRKGDHQVLVVNPGAVSTKLALFKGEETVWEEVVYHPEDRLVAHENVAHQEDYRYQEIRKTAESRGVSWEDLSAVVGRGGLMKPVASGTYLVNDALLSDLRRAYQGEHASNLGALIAHRLARPLSIPAFVVDPVAVDEMDPLARYSGLKGIERRSLSHALNIKAVCREVSEDMGLEYEEARLVAVHLGSGISVTAHRFGRMVDVNNAVEGGPFGTERAGGLPILQLVGWALDLASQGKDARTLQRMLTRTGGLFSYLGTRDLRDIEQDIDRGNSKAEEVVKALAYQVAKEIGAMCAVLSGRVDAIILTGAMARSERLVDLVSQRVKGFAPLKVVPGEKEMEALALGAVRVLEGLEEAREYS